MAFCVNCGQEIAAGAAFCTNCGAPQFTHMQAQAPDQGAGPVPPAQDPGSAGSPGQEGASSESYGSQADYGASGSYSSQQGSYAYRDGGPSWDYGYAGGPMGGAPVPSPSFFETVRSTITENYANFNGRARRSEYWYFTLFSSMASLLASFVGSMLVRNGGDVNILSSLVSLALFLPGLGVTVRRLHDIGKSGWWYLLALVPVIGWIILLVFYCRDSQAGPNLYGPSPKYPG